MVHQGVFQCRWRIKMSHDSHEQDKLFSELTSFLSDAADAAIAARVKLRDAVCVFVVAEQARGISLKAVIHTVRDILSAAEKDGMKSTDDLAAQLVNWCREFHKSTRPIEPAVIS